MDTADCTPAKTSGAIICSIASELEVFRFEEKFPKDPRGLNVGSNLFATV